MAIKDVDPAFPKLLYFADFPPSNLAGGPVLVSRLLGGYPRKQLLVLTGSVYTRQSTNEGRLGCREVALPVTNQTGRWGTGRLKAGLDVLLLAVWAIYAAVRVKKENVEVILTVAHSYFLLAACGTAILTGRPLVVIVHDDWVSTNWRGIIPAKRFYRWLYGAVLRRASRVYAISPPMCDALAREYRVNAVLQMPGVAIDEANPGRDHVVNVSRPRIVYCGSVLGLSEDGLDTLAQIIADGTLARRGLPHCEFEIYSNQTAGQLRRRAAAWSSPQIRIEPWLNQAALRAALAAADVLFLPHSFAADQRDLVRTSFPTKTGDYLAANRAILVFAPEYSAITRYAKQYGLAEVVDRGNPELLADGIVRLVTSDDRRRTALRNGRRTLDVNHRLESIRSCFYDDIRSLARPQFGEAIAGSATSMTGQT